MNTMDCLQIAVVQDQSQIEHFLKTYNYAYLWGLCLMPLLKNTHFYDSK